MSRESQDQHILEQLPPSRAQKLLKIITSYYFIALVIGAGFAYLFGWLAEEVTENEFGVDNTAILLNIHAHRSALLDRIAFSFTWIGSPWGIVLISVLMLAGLWKLKRYVDIGMYGAVLLGASVMVVTLKLFFHQLRPQVFTPLVRETSFSFPSGHSLTSFAVWGFVAWWVVSIDPKQVWRWLLGVLGVLIAGLVALSRLYLGVHWPTDVLAGFLLGFGWVAVCALGQRWLTRHARRERRKQLHEKRLARKSISGVS
ncbi:MAG TPA: phosphatase PAP2 family protein [Candidatus Kapabacteria bacterium]|nr:phosphatase PAP2 family protein [Candidatus Kapabacteria bacterium]